MAAFVLRSHIRRVKQLIATPRFRLIAIFLGLFVVVRWVLAHNHDGVRSRDLGAIGTRSVEDERIDWSRLYYVQYATSADDLCNALMLWSQMEEIGSRAQRTMIYPSTWDTSPDVPSIKVLLQSAARDYYVKLRPSATIYDRKNGNEQNTKWSNPAKIKLLSFNLTDFDRVLVLDSSSMVLQNLDAVFLIPRATVAMPYVYWGPSSSWQFSNQMMLIQPSAAGFAAVEAALEDEGDEVDVINKLYKGKIRKIPQRPYHFLSGEFRRKDHSIYLRSRSRKWNPDAALGEARYLHFSDSPLPKPWVKIPKHLMNKYMPECKPNEWFGATDCRDRTIWLKLYHDYALRRKAVCGHKFEVRSQDPLPDPVSQHGRSFHTDAVG